MTGQSKEALKKKANQLRKTLAEVDKLTGQTFILTKRSEVAEFFGYSLASVDKWLASGMPGTRGKYDIKQMVRWLRTEGPWRPLGGNRGTAEDLMDEGPESEWSEEYRKWKARLAEVDYHKRVGALMSVELFRRVMVDAFADVRQFAERQILAHGNGTAEDWAETIERFERKIQDVIGQPGDSDRDRAVSVGSGAAESSTADDDIGVGRGQHPPADRSLRGKDVPSSTPPG